MRRAAAQRGIAARACATAARARSWLCFGGLTPRIAQQGRASVVVGLASVQLERCVCLAAGFGVRHRASLNSCWPLHDTSRRAAAPPRLLAVCPSRYLSLREDGADC